MVSIKLSQLLSFKQVSALQTHKRKTAPHRRFTSKKAKQVFSLSRWLHIYISCALFTLLLFFCITGVTLNHLDWASHNAAKQQSYSLPSELVTLTENDEYPIKKIQHFVEAKLGLKNPRSIDLALDLGEITYDFSLPSGYAFVTVFLDDQFMEVESVHGGLLAILNDLHKGRHSGEAWSWVIDISAILMGLFTLTGIIILLQNAKHRRQALWVLMMGSLTPVAIYFIAVPHLSI